MSKLISLSNKSCDGVVHIDDRHFPLIVMYWVGTPDAELCTDVFAWRDKMLERAAAKGEFAIVIHHTNKMVNPSATARRRTAEVAPAGPQLLGNYVVANNPLLRGVMTALKWMAGDSIKITTYAKIDDALTTALKALDSAGTIPPLTSASAYAPPEGVDAS